MPGPLNPGNH